MALYLVLLAFFSVISIALTLLWGRKKVKTFLAETYEVRNSNGIEILDVVDIRGTKQWIHVRGRNKENPLLLFVHGGPGAPNIGYFDHIQRPWEDFFTVVHWDQRQTGKSYMPNIGHTISHETYINDAEEMIGHLRRRFGQEKVFLMATSYGTYLSMHMLKRHPDWFYAYVAIGQVVKMADHASEEYRLLLEQAKMNNEVELVERLESMAPFPDPKDPASDYLENAVFFMETASRMGKCYPNSFQEAFKNYHFLKWVSPLCTLKDSFNRLFGDTPAPADKDNPFYKGFFDYDLPGEVGSTFETPIFFFTGVDDFHVAYTLTDQWFKKIEAPYKEQVWFDRSAHAAHITEPYAFSKALIEKVLPLAPSCNDK